MERAPGRSPGGVGAELQRNLESIAAIPVTPFTSSLEVDLEAYRRVLTQMLTNGIDLITANGNTSEFYSLSPAELRMLVEATMDVCRDKATVVVGVSFDVSTAREMARFARDAGAAAIMVHQPVHPYRSPAGWVAYHAAIADANPELGIIPYIRDPGITGRVIAELASGYPNFIAVKYAVPNPIAMRTALEVVEPGRLTWLCGLAELWAPFFWVAGARGFTSGLVNVDQTLPRRLLDSLRTGNWEAVWDVWNLVRPFEELRAQNGSANNVSVVKEALHRRHICESFVRPPITPLGNDDCAVLEEIMNSWPLAAR